MAQTTAPSSVSVVVPVRNRRCLVEHCLRHLEVACSRAARHGVDAEIVVVDDASEDGTADAVAGLAARADGRLRLVRQSERRGPGVTRNAGIRAAGGELIVFVDSDVLVVPEFLEAHVAAHRQAGRQAVAVGSVRTVPSVEAALRRPPARLWDVSTNPLDTANASVLKEHLLAVGLFDSGFEGYGWEDIDLGWRLMKLGLKRVHARDAVGYHVKPPVQSEADLERLLANERERARTARYLLSKYPGWDGRLTVQDSRVHGALNWFLRMGGLIRKDNVGRWMTAAQRLGLPGLARIWLAGVLTQEYLRALRGELDPSRDAVRASGGSG